jgi:pyruvate formate lyase activating enzyme
MRVRRSGRHRLKREVLAGAKGGIRLEELRGLVCGVQKFAIHDGPGIRTLVYMKGCPIRCLWCSTPQSQRRRLDLLHVETQCQRCGRCVEACPIGAIMLSEEEGIQIDRVLCNSCAECVTACPNQALELVGTYVTVDELFREVQKDSPFYRRSNGGVTVGGGEPTMQHEFVAAFLDKCQRHYMHTAIETCGYARWEHLDALVRHVDLAYFDIKHMDPEAHKELTGASNELILDNARRVAAMRPMIIRIPTVPGCNDSDDNILDTATFAAGLGENLQRIELLPYHKFGTQTYGRLGMDYELTDVEPPSDEHMRRLKAIIESCGVKAQIGG